MTARRRATRKLPSVDRRVRCVTIAALLAASCAAAHAEDVLPIAAVESARWLFGVSASRAPEYPGSDKTAIKLRPLWAWQYGRLRISTSRASGLLGFGVEARGPGASLEMFSSDRIKFGAALRVDSGRSASDSALLAGLPSVRPTLRGRLYGSYTIDDHWGVGAAVSQDLLGRGGGAAASLELGYHAPLGPRTEWTAGVGATYGNGPYMRTYFGISPESSQLTGIPAYAPSAGLRDLHAGIGLTSLLSDHWIAFAGLGTASLRGQAAASPLTRAKSSPGATAGITYRWGP